MNKIQKKKRFDKIVADIKRIKIQGARNIAKVALKAYILLPGKKSREILMKSRPTEPMMYRVLQMAMTGVSHRKILEHFGKAQEQINRPALKLVKSGDIIFTHCHSTNVSRALIHAKKKGKKFQVYLTETRPLFQGRRTAKELRKAHIPVTMFVDSAVDVALSQRQVRKVFLGADALLKKGVINKIGSKMIAELARIHKIPVYIIADSWKFTKQNIPIEQRSLNEIWDTAPKNIKIKNPAFEFVPKKYIKGIVTEFGLMRYVQFVKKMK